MGRGAELAERFDQLHALNAHIREPRASSNRSEIRRRCAKTPRVPAPVGSRDPVGVGPISKHLVHLSGHYSNPPEALETVLQSALEVSSTRQRVSTAALAKAKRLGNGVVQRAVIRAPRRLERVSRGRYQLARSR